MSPQITAVLLSLFVSMALTQNIKAPVIKTSGSVKLDVGGLCPRPPLQPNGMFLSCGTQGEQPTLRMCCVANGIYEKSEYDSFIFAELTSDIKRVTMISNQNSRIEFNDNQVKLILNCKEQGECIMNGDYIIETDISAKNLSQ